MKRALVLKKETLVELTTDELRGVAGGVRMTPACPSNYAQSCNIDCLASVIAGCGGTDVCYSDTCD